MIERKVFFSFFIFVFLFVFSPPVFSIDTCEYMQANTDFPDTSGIYTMVYYFGYPDRSSAEAACEESHSSCGTTVNQAYYSNQYFSPPTSWHYYVCDDCDDSCPLDNVCDEDQCSISAACNCADKGGVIWEDESACEYHCADDCEEQYTECADIAACECGSEPVVWIDESRCNYRCGAVDDCPDSDDDGLPDCCGGNADCPDSDEDGIYDCCGDGSPCEDSDNDGSPDSCDPCPDDPSITHKEICVYKVNNYCDGLGTLRTGNVCGTSTTSCDGEDDCSSNGDEYVFEGTSSDCSFACCSKESCYTVACEVDPVTCKAKSCECPNGEDTCEECKAAGCECPDGGDSCEECQLPKTCECPEGSTVPCAECQKPDCTCDDGTSDPCAECQYPTPSGDDGTCICSDGSTACAECQDPDCTCPDDEEFCESCQKPLPPSTDPIPYFPTGEFPDSLSVGGCFIDLAEMKEWLLGDESFPFNFIYAFNSLIQPLVESSYSDDVLLTYSLVPPGDIYFQDYEMVFDLSEYPALVAVGRFVNWCITMTLVFSMIVYSVKRYHNFHGLSR
jgi:hypothetical protein